jgi:Glycine zipper 2TM domain
MQHMTNQRLKLRIWSVLGLSALLVACEAPPPRRTVVVAQPVPAPIMVYPAQGQSAEQLERDRYECHTWAVQQTGFDPSRPGLPPDQRVVVQPANPPGTGTAVGAIAGAILGAAIAGPRDAGFGAVFGGLTGAAIGSTSDANAQAQANYEQRRLDQNYASGQAAASNYRRAISACLDARGYKTA